MVNKLPIIVWVLLTFVTHSGAQPVDSTRRGQTALIAGGVLYGGSLVALDRLWYADHERTGFHFFNDNNEWKQIDKVGHFYSAFHLSSMGHYTARWAGLENNKALLAGALTATLILTPIEVFDGFSDAYGASVGDLVANTAGAALYYGQQKAWGEIIIQPKYSFNRSPYPKQRPDVLGATIIEELLKDYNAQHYWLSIDLSKFTSLPKWLNLAVGYGAQGMVYARDEQNTAIGLSPRRQFYLAIDLDFHEYRMQSKFVNTILYFINMVHLPAPTLELSHGNLNLHLVHY